MKTKRKIIIAILTIPTLIINFPFKHTTETDHINIFEGHTLVGQRKWECFKGYSYCSLLWEYRYVCTSHSKFDHMRKELIFFDTIGFTWGEEDIL